MKKKEPKITILKKEKNPNNPKDYLPNNLIDKLIPQSSIYYPQNKIEQNNNYKPLFFPNDIPEEWNNKTIEEINEEIYSNEQNTIFSDEDHDIIIGNIPLCLIEITNNSIEWERPSSYVINYSSNPGPPNHFHRHHRVNKNHLPLSTTFFVFLLFLLKAQTHQS